MSLRHRPRLFLFSHHSATTEIHTLSLHDALPICDELPGLVGRGGEAAQVQLGLESAREELVEAERQDVVEGRGGRQKTDRKSTRLNSSHSQISYAVFCLKKKKKAKTNSGEEKASH